MDGILPFDKPAGISSAWAVNRIKPLLPRKTKIGHAGTLDSFATGLLLLLIGKATGLCEQLMDQPKQYQATVKFGATTVTDDPESAEQICEVRSIPTIQQVREAVQLFVGTIQQVPPMYSALKIQGRRSSDMARRGAPVVLKSRPVRIDAIELLDYTWPLLKLRIDCGRGTYIRALARDLGEKLAVGGYLAELRRTRIGDFDIANTATFDGLRQHGVGPYLREPSYHLEPRRREGREEQEKEGAG
jgi:tRNA pseudouridine55 synthase